MSQQFTTEGLKTYSRTTEEGRKCGTGVITLDIGNERMRGWMGDDGDWRREEWSGRVNERGNRKGELNSRGPAGTIRFNSAGSCWKCSGFLGSRGENRNIWRWWRVECTLWFLLQPRGTQTRFSCYLCPPLPPKQPLMWFHSELRVSRDDLPAGFGFI